MDAGVYPPDLLYLISLTEPRLLTPDLVARAVAWRPPTTSYPAAPPLERPADETWVLLEEWLAGEPDPADPASLVTLCWIYGAGTAETCEFWASNHPSDLVQARNEITQGAATAASLLGLEHISPSCLSERIDAWSAESQTGLPWSEALASARGALLVGSMPRALRTLLDAVPFTDAESSARAVELAELARRLGLLDLSATLLGAGGEGPRHAVVAARLGLCMGRRVPVGEGELGLSLRLIAALDQPLADADRALVALREGAEPCSVEDQWLYACAAAWLARRGLAGEAWGRARRDAARWRSDDPALMSLWGRLAKRRRPTPEDLRDWMDRCPL